ncbi:DUF4365 domain-containing protein [Actinosynnema sp. NPDC002837]
MWVCPRGGKRREAMVMGKGVARAGGWAAPPRCRLRSRQREDAGMRREPSARVASEGVTHTRLAVQAELGWLFRDQPTEDCGIDAHAKVVDGEDVRGRLLALQIKGGMGYFREAAPTGWWFRPDAGHVASWLNHSLPVAVVLYRPESKRCHWQAGGVAACAPQLRPLPGRHQAFSSRHRI